MKQNVIPAPIDGKNITRDWIETIFDNCDHIVGGKSGNIFMGFVNGRPTNCFVNDNSILWHIDEYSCGSFVLKDAYNELLRRLKAADDESSDAIVDYSTFEDKPIIMQRFYFKVD